MQPCTHYQQPALGAVQPSAGMAQKGSRSPRCGRAAREGRAVPPAWADKPALFRDAAWPGDGMDH